MNNNQIKEKKALLEKQIDAWKERVLHAMDETEGFPVTYRMIADIDEIISCACEQSRILGNI